MTRKKSEKAMRERVSERRKKRPSSRSDRMAKLAVVTSPRDRSHPTVLAVDESRPRGGYGNGMQRMMEASEKQEKSNDIGALRL